MRTTVALLLLTLSAAASAETPTAPPVNEPGTSEMIQGRADRERRLTVPVRIGGRGPYDFVIDTGSQRSLVSSSVAARLALPASQTLHIVDIGGRAEVATALAEEFGIGRTTYRNLVLPVLLDEHLAAEGVVGTDNMQGQRILLDFARNRLEIGDAKSLGGNGGYEIVVTARRKSGQLIITEALIEGIRVNVVIDTGAETSIGNRALQRVLSKRGKTETVTLLSVTGKEITADLAWHGRLEIGSATITNPLIAFADSPVFAALDLDKRPAMLLGMRELRLFKRVAIDFRTRRVLFDLPAGV
jgi:predicted aspartyl protease